MDKILILVVLASLVWTGFAQDPEIVDEIWPEVKPVGRVARLNCTVANKLDHTVYWEFMSKTREIISKDEDIMLDKNPVEGGKRKYEVQKRRSVDRVTYMLIIRRLREQNSGKYRCYVKIQATDHTKWPSKIGILTVQVAPTIRPGETDAVMEIDRGANVNLTCNATGIPFPNITWTRSDGEKLPTGAAQFRGAVLPLMDATVQMAGVYRCIADNNIKPPAQYLAEIHVFGKPEVRVTQDSVGQNPGNQYSAKLECIARGYPAPTVKWWRIFQGGLFPCNDDQKFQFNKQTTDNQNLKSGEEWYTLKVKNVEANDLTLYICVAENDMGRNEANVTMFFTPDCQGPNCPSTSSSRGSEVKVSLDIIAVAVLFNFAIYISRFLHHRP